MLKQTEQKSSHKRYQILKTFLHVENLFLTREWKVTDIESYNLGAGKSLGGHRWNLAPNSGIHMTTSLLSSACTAPRQVLSQQLQEDFRSL